MGGSYDIWELVLMELLRYVGRYLGRYLGRRSRHVDGVVT